MLVSSPRTWGCFRCPDNAADQQAVFPTHVGVFLSAPAKAAAAAGLPHARGGVSIQENARYAAGMSSPRTWGCFSDRPPGPRPGSVFPTHVGVFLPAASSIRNYPSLPHARGGVSIAVSRSIGMSSSSPRTWGCFQLLAAGIRRARVFPTHVGVFLDADPPVHG